MPPLLPSPPPLKTHTFPTLQQDAAEWAVIYIRYLQIFRSLEAAYDQLLHPQKRQDVRRALEATAGRALEVRHLLARLGGAGGAGARGGALSSAALPPALPPSAPLDAALVDLKLAPEALEVPAPRYFLEDRAQVMAVVVCVCVEGCVVCVWV